MDDPAEAAEIWFERIGPTVGGLGSYLPVTVKGLYALLGHTLPVLVLWVLPLGLLARFEIVWGAVALSLVLPGVIGSFLLLMRTAHRHSRPWRG